MSATSSSTAEMKRANSTSGSSKSMESLYLINSLRRSTIGLKRQQINQGSRHESKSVTNETRKRVISARVNRMKQLQNQVVDLQQHISELMQENRILRTVHKRQDSALSKYENTNAELPKLLHSHAEEVRMWQAKHRSLQNQNKDLIIRIKQKDAMILQLSDQNKHLVQLNKNKSLEEREKLTERVSYLQEQLINKDNDLRLLSRRLQLDAKHSRTLLHAEQQKYKETRNKLDSFEAIKSSHSLNTKFSSNLSKPVSTTRMKAVANTKQSNLIANFNNLSLNGNENTIGSNEDDFLESEPKLHVVSYLRSPSSSEIIDNHDILQIRTPITVRSRNPSSPNIEIDNVGNNSDLDLLIKNESYESKSFIKEYSSSKRREEEKNVNEDEHGSDDDGADDDIISHYSRDSYKTQNGYSFWSRKSSISKTSQIELNSDADHSSVSLGNGHGEPDDLKRFQDLTKSDLIDKSSYLNDVCETMTQDVEKLINDVAVRKKLSMQSEIKNKIDPKKKLQLLAALKAIDNNESFEHQ